MKHAKHTPGPWKLLDHDEDYISITDDVQDEGVCKITGTYDRETIKANARLIAAAPELFEQLQAFVSYAKDLVRRENQFGNTGPLVVNFEYVDKLLAKATGDSIESEDEFQNRTNGVSRTGDE